MNSRRGAIMVESALTLTVILFFLYGALQLGVVGLEQLTVDGGAFAMAHQQSFQFKKQPPYTDAFSRAQQALPHLKEPNVAPLTSLGEPPTTAFAGQYGFNTPNARYGGVSLIQPVQTIVSITKSQIENLLLGLTGSTLSVTGTAIEPTYLLINGHADVAGNNFNSVAAFNTKADPLSESAPPYLVGFNYLQSCPYQYVVETVPASWSTCPAPVLSALGSAEYLDAHNWARGINGVVSSPGQPAVFWETRYHQKLYAEISASLLAAAPDPGQTTKKKILDPSGSDPRYPQVACVYNFDNLYSGAYPPGYVGVGYPLLALHPDYTSATCIAP